MPPGPKRKRPQDEVPGGPPSKSPTPNPPRRTTRRAAATAASEQAKPLRSGRIRAITVEDDTPTGTSAEGAEGAHEESDDAPEPKPKGRGRGRAAAAPAPAKPGKTTRSTRRHLNVPGIVESVEGTSDQENVSPEAAGTMDTVVIPPPKARAAAPRPIRPAEVDVVQPKQSIQTPRAHSRVLPTRPSQSASRPPPPMASTSAAPAGPSFVTPKQRSSLAQGTMKPPSTPHADRNVDKVVFGNISFRAWYPSYYPRDVLADSSGNGAPKPKVGGGKKDKEVLLDQLFVCPRCFKYSREFELWFKHFRYCHAYGEIPGRKIYTHPKGTDSKERLVSVPGPIPTPSEGPIKDLWRELKGPNLKGKEKYSVTAPSGFFEKGEEKGEWSVWEVNSDKHKLFCQNLSLFAKLFLDNKSVYYDTTPFDYFLLVYTSPPLKTKKANRQSDSTQGEVQETAPLAHIVGFFSKEKNSWEQNNLACILIFPPWQRKGLGALLMGVSYEISRRHGAIGGPEKPISNMGIRGYKRYWSGEIARWLLCLPLRPLPGEEEYAENRAPWQVDIEDCSRATMIHSDDCLMVLREMDLVYEVANSPLFGPRAGAGAVAKPAGDEPDPNEIKPYIRVRVDKAAVMKWVEEHNIPLDRPCDPDGFVEGYAMKDEGDE